MTNDYNEEEFLDKFAKRIAYLRNSKSMTQEKLSEESGIDRVAIANIETRKRRPTVRTVYRISRSLNIPIKNFFDFD